MSSIKLVTYLSLSTVKADKEGEREYCDAVVEESDGSVFVFPYGQTQDNAVPLFFMDREDLEEIVRLVGGSVVWD